MSTGDAIFYSVIVICCVAPPGLMLFGIAFALLMDKISEKK